MSRFLRPSPFALACVVVAVVSATWCLPPSSAGTISEGKEFTNSIGMKFVRIEPGKFTMGSPKDEKDRFDDEGPQREVEITKPFYMGVSPVTRGQFAAFAKGDGYRTEAEKDGKSWGCNPTTHEFEEGKYSWRDPGFAQTDDHPVVELTWNDAEAFCAWLSKREGKTYELPTEAEWEYACRAGTKTRFWCGDADRSLNGAANIADAALKAKLDADYAKSFTFQTWNDGYPFTSPVGSFKANPWGLYDMHGNVWQWCADQYGKYQEGYIKDPKNATSGDFPVLRGGNWGDDPMFCRSACRTYVDPGGRDSFIGFRVVLRPAPRIP